MDSIEERLRESLQAVRDGRLSRRAWLQQVAPLGLTLPMLHALLGPDARAQATEGFVYRPTRRGGGGALRILAWQGATILNQHLANGVKDNFAAALFLEPLAAFDQEGRLKPILAEHIPTVDNGGVARDGLSVTWRLKRGVSWHDGQPLDADDLVATWEFARHPETGAFTAGSFKPITVRKLDSHTVRIGFEHPTPFWADAFVSQMVLPRRHFAAWIGAKAHEAPANRRPVGTGPYRIVDFKPGDLVRGELNPAYHMPHRPHFDSVEIKGGGDAVSAARAVLQTGEYHFGWNILVEDEVLERIERGNKGRMVFTPSGTTEFLSLNHADPWTEVQGERSHPSSRHPFLLEPAVRQAIAHLVDRESIHRFIFGRSAAPTVNFLNGPAPFFSQRRGAEFDIAKAGALLDAGGWVRGSDGIRSKGGRRLKMLFQTSVSPPRQKIQTIIKQAALQAGIEIDLKAITSSVFFSSDPGNPDTLGKFQADLQLSAITRANTDPGRFMELFCSWAAASKANNWLGRNNTRWRNDEYDRIFRAADQELDPVKRAAMLIRLNDIVCGDHAIVPLVVRTRPNALANGLHAPVSGWANEAAFVHDWYRG